MRAALCSALLLALAACAPAPRGDERSAAADHEAVSARLREAEGALGEGRFAAAEMALLRALARADAPEQAAIQARLDADALVVGLRWARAREGDDAATLARVAEEIAASNAPVAAEARGWLEVERPRALIQAVRSACGEAHRGSCTEARSALVAAKLTGPEASEALALADAEAARVAPIVARAEGYLRIFAAEGKKKKVLERCLDARMTDTPDQGQLHDTCEEEAYGSDAPEEVYQRRRSNEALFRRALAAIADPALTRVLAARRARALAEGSAGSDELPLTLRAGRSP